mmetsp:Transcript_7462/g.25686  ORF Transcript_7462/g.25686 Transcript_7462/m.25686 type:complete len:348 (-) Transcript_7462:234-1277(-)
MEVPGNSPPAAQQQQGGLGLALGGLVGGLDVLWLPAPHLGLASGGPEDLPLLVGGPVDVDHQQAESGNRGRDRGTELSGVVHQVERRGGVNAGHPNEASPANVEPGAVVGNVHRAEVPGLPQEKLEDIDVHENDADQHGVGDRAGLLKLLGHETQGEDGPAHQAHSAVGPLLDVKVLADPGVQLRAPKVVKKEAPSAPRVRAAGEVATLHCEEEAKDVAEDVQRVEHLPELVVHPGGLERGVLPAGEEGNECDQVGLHPVRLVHRPVALGGRRPHKLLAGHQKLQCCLERSKGRDVVGGLPRQGREGIQKGLPVLAIGQVQREARCGPAVLHEDAPQRERERRGGQE